jgi:hypothetical protein
MVLLCCCFVARYTILVALPLLARELQNMMDLYHANISDFFSTIAILAIFLFSSFSNMSNTISTNPLTVPIYLGYNDYYLILVQK